MNKILIMFYISMIPQVAFAKSMTACFNVEGMTCATCTVTTKVAIKKLDGIESVEVSLDEKKTIVHYNDDKTNAGEIKKKIDSVGYKATHQECKKG